MTRYTILGASGYVGGRIAAALRREGAEVYAPARDEQAVLTRDLGRVFYCIGMTSDYASRPAATVEAHGGILARLLQRARFERIVYLSSTRLYDEDASGAGDPAAPLRIDPRKPRSLFDLSKALGENLCLTASDGRGCVARLSGVFDMNEDATGFLSQWLQRARRERGFALDSAGGFARDYIHSDDAVRALRKMLDTQGSTIWNVASGVNMSNADIASLMNARGWHVSFTKSATPQSLPACDVSALVTHAVTPRSPRVLIETWLDGINRPWN